MLEEDRKSIAEPVKRREAMAQAIDILLNTLNVGEVIEKERDVTETADGTNSVRVVEEGQQCLAEYIYSGPPLRSDQIKAARHPVVEPRPIGHHKERPVISA